MKSNIEHLLSASGSFIIRHTAAVLFSAFLITGLAVYGIMRLPLDISLFSLMPRKTEAALELETIQEHFASAQTIFVILEGGTPQTLREAADAAAIVLRGEEYADLILSVSGDSGTAVFEPSPLLPALAGESADLLSFHDPPAAAAAWNRKLSLLLDSQNLTSLKKEQIRNWLARLHTLLEGYRTGKPDEELTAAFAQFLEELLLSPPYIMNDEQTMAILIVRPKFSPDEGNKLQDYIGRIEEGVLPLEGVYDISLGLSGAAVTARDEALLRNDGLPTALLLTGLLIIILITFTFRMKSTLLVAGIPLLAGVIVTFAAAGYMLGRINIVSAMFTLGMFGLGIDTAVHYLTAFIREREKGTPFTQSICTGAARSGPAILTGAVTAAAAAALLGISDSSILRELSVTAAVGIITVPLVMLLLLPAMLTLRNSWIRVSKRKDSLISMRSSASISAYTGRLISRFPGAVFLVFATAAFFFLINAFDVQTEADPAAADSAVLESIALEKRTESIFGITPGTLSIRSGSLEQTRALVGQLEKLESIARIDAVTRYLPDQTLLRELHGAAGQQLEQISRNEEKTGSSPLSSCCRTAVEQLDSEKTQSLLLSLALLIDNLRVLSLRTEYAAHQQLVSLLNPLLSTSRTLLDLYATLAALLADAAASELAAEMTDLQQLPEELKRIYLSGRGEENLITIYPKRSIWEEENREQLYRELELTGVTAVGPVRAADELSGLSASRLKRLILPAAVLIYVLLLIHLGNFKLALVSMAPLAAETATIIGIMPLLGISLNSINITVLPFVTAVGTAEALRISRLYRSSSRGGFEAVLAEAGRPLLLTSLTAGIGFSALIPVSAPALRSHGILLILAVTSILIYSVALQGPLLVIVRERLKLPFDPKLRRERR
jgi:uncharacterized protein